MFPYIGRKSPTPSSGSDEPLTTTRLELAAERVIEACGDDAIRRDDLAVSLELSTAKQRVANVALRGEVDHWKAKTEKEAVKCDRLLEEFRYMQGQLGEVQRESQILEARIIELLAGNLSASKAETVFDRYAVAALQSLIRRGNCEPDFAADEAFTYAKAAMIRRNECLPLMASFSNPGESARQDFDSPATQTEEGPDTEDQRKTDEFEVPVQIRSELNGNPQ